MIAREKELQQCPQVAGKCHYGSNQYAKKLESYRDLLEIYILLQRVGSVQTRASVRLLCLHTLRRFVGQCQVYVMIFRLSSDAKTSCLNAGKYDPYKLAKGRRIESYNPLSCAAVSIS